MKQVGATIEDVLTVPVKASEIPIGAMLWDGANVIKVARIEVAEKQTPKILKFVSKEGDPFFAAAENQIVRVVCGASKNMIGKLAFYSDKENV